MRSKVFPCFLAGFIYVIGSIVFAELFSFAALSAKEKKIVSLEHLYDKKIEILNANDHHSDARIAQAASGNEDVLHPYLGFVLNHTIHNDLNSCAYW